jgi:hypothetical protein
MKCEKPAHIRITPMMQAATSIKRAALVPCGQCLNCRINQARVWTNRILLEQNMHGNNCFVTLTYDDEHLPDPAWVSVSQLQKYIKRLRYYMEPIKFRYYGVGEYGKLWRPHYHMILFGVDGSLSERPIRAAWKDDNGKSRCNKERLTIDELSPATARYITGYITKKIDKITDNHPVSYGKADEFRISSTKNGGIGIKAAEHIKKIVSGKPYDVPRVRELRIGRKKYPIGRYLDCKINGNKSWQQRLVDFKAMQEALTENLRTRQIKQGKAGTERRKL